MHCGLRALCSLHALCCPHAVNDLSIKYIKLGRQLHDGSCTARQLYDGSCSAWQLHQAKSEQQGAPSTVMWSVMVWWSMCECAQLCCMHLTGQSLQFVIIRWALSSLFLTKKSGGQPGSRGKLDWRGRIDGRLPKVHIRGQRLRTLAMSTYACMHACACTHEAYLHLPAYMQTCLHARLHHDVHACQWMCSTGKQLSSTKFMLTCICATVPLSIKHAYGHARANMTSCIISRLKVYRQSDCKTLNYSQWMCMVT